MTMTESTIICPNCNTEFPLTASLAAPLIEATRKSFERQLAQKESDFSRREAAIRSEKEAVVAAQASIEEELDKRLKAGQASIAAAEAKKARVALESDLSSRDQLISELNQTVQQLNQKLSTAQTVEVEFRRKERELSDKLREADLIVEKRVTESLSLVESKARQRVEEEGRLRMAEKDKVIADAQRQIDEMKRKMEQGSQQLQGEVQELELESQLRARFPMDAIDPVPKGEYGGDTIHRIQGTLGQRCGAILWESKRTKNWSDSWLSKLREDQRTAKAELAIIVTQALPKGVESFDLIDGIWITTPRLAMALASVLRQSLVDLASARQASEGQQTKMEVVYQYLTGPRFRQRIQAVVEKFSDMHDDLDKERKAMTRLWAKREEQIRSVIDATAGMYGDLQGIAGKSLQEIEGLSLSALPDLTESNAGGKANG